MVANPLASALAVASDDSTAAATNAFAPVHHHSQVLAFSFPAVYLVVVSPVVDIHAASVPTQVAHYRLPTMDHPLPWLSPVVDEVEV